MTSEHKAWLSAGSNLGDRELNLVYALTALTEKGAKVTRKSRWYETEPVGYVDQPWFLNLALEVQTALPPRALLQLCLEIEKTRGRERTFVNAPRSLDLDLLLYEDFIVAEQDLIIPHPRMAQRRFVLEPLAEIAPDILHPILHKTIRSLLELCADSSAVRIHASGDPTGCIPI